MIRGILTRIRIFWCKRRRNLQELRHARALFGALGFVPSWRLASQRLDRRDQSIATMPAAYLVTSADASIEHRAYACVSICDKSVDEISPRVTVHVALPGAWTTSPFHDRARGLGMWNGFGLLAPTRLMTRCHPTMQPRHPAQMSLQHLIRKQRHPLRVQLAHVATDGRAGWALRPRCEVAVDTVPSASRSAASSAVDVQVEDVANRVLVRLLP